MNYEEMNNHIYKYMVDDKLGNAIMISGKWGAGKSFYINNFLKSYIEARSKKCIVISLYGFSDISDISKAIYLELRTIIKEPRSEAKRTTALAGKIIGKTIINGLISKIGVDIEQVKEKELRRIYESVNLKDTLVVLEDIERTSINIISLLGYVNNLCENDGVKVVLVTNEQEILSITEKSEDTGFLNAYKKRAYDYSKAKEKTVSDTIKFVCDYKKVIPAIIKEFGDCIEQYGNKENIKEINNIFITLNSNNLRAFKYGCQKSKDILYYLNSNNIDGVSDEIRDMIFFGIIAFTLRVAKGETLLYPGNSIYTTEISHPEHPLFRFCYNYIVHQTLDGKEIREAINQYENYSRNSIWKSGKNKDLLVLKDFSIKTEKEVVRSIANLSQDIINGSIPSQDYITIINYLVIIKYDVGITEQVEEVINLILRNLKEKEIHIKQEELFSSTCVPDSKEAKDKWKALKGKISEALENNSSLVFPSNPEKIEEYCNKKGELKAYFYSRGFATRIEKEKFIILLKKASAKQISDLVTLFKFIYDKSILEISTDEEYHSLHELVNGMSELCTYDKYDKIQKMQIKRLGDCIANSTKAVKEAQEAMSNSMNTLLKNY